jgi:hypothetical protein
MHVFINYSLGDKQNGCPAGSTSYKPCPAIIPHANLFPAFPVFLDSSFSPLPKSSLSL